MWQKKARAVLTRRTFLRTANETRNQKLAHPDAGLSRDPGELIDPLV